MTGYFRMLVAVVALAALPGLSGCLGGGGGGSTTAPAAQMPWEPAPEPMAEPAADPDPAPMAEPSGRSRWQAADVWQLGSFSGLSYSNRINGGGRWSNLDDQWGYFDPLVNGDSNGAYKFNTHSVSPLSDGSGVRVRMEAADQRENYTGSFGNDSPPVTFDSSGGPVSRIGTEEALLGHVEWDSGDGDDGRWTAWGWWLAYRGTDFMEDAQGLRSFSLVNRNAAASAVFADGAEFRSRAASLPETGIGRYRGTGRGIFTAFNTTDTSFHSGRGFGAAKKQGMGEFTASVDLTMDYGDVYPERYPEHAAMTAEIRVVRMDGQWWDTPGKGFKAPEKITQEFGASGGPAWRYYGSVFLPITDPDPSEQRDAPFQPIGAFGRTDGHTYRHPDDTTLEDPRRFEVISGFGPVLSENGNIIGRLSTVPGAGDHPRRAMGLFWAEGSGGSGDDVMKHEFSGAFLAPLVE